MGIYASIRAWLLEPRDNHQRRVNDASEQLAETESAISRPTRASRAGRGSTETDQRHRIVVKTLKTL